VHKLQLLHAGVVLSYASNIQRKLSIFFLKMQSLFLLQAGLDPLSEGSATWVLRLHSALFSTSIKSSRKSSMLYFNLSSQIVFIYDCVPYCDSSQ